MTGHRGDGSEAEGYITLGVLDRGGAGTVLRCHHRETGELVALKRTTSDDPSEKEGLRREIATLSRLTRAGRSDVVRLLDHGSNAGGLWYAMELIEGPDIAGWLRGSWEDGHDTQARILRVFRDLALALSFIHDEGVVHGDVTSRNVMMRASSEPVLIDFGTARRAFAEVLAREIVDQTGMRRGTPGYMAPEQVLGSGIDARCDLYAFGVLLYEALAGRPPLIADSPAALARQHVMVVPQPPSHFRPGIAPPLESLVMQLLEKDPARRIGHAEQIAALLDAVADLPPSRDATAVTRKLARLYRPRLAGRSGVLSLLQERLGRALSGAPQLVLVAGESGIGKTRLMNEFGATAATSGCHTVVGTCGERREEESDQTVSDRPLRVLTPLIQLLVDRWPNLPPTGRDRLQHVLSVLAPFEASAGVLAQGWTQLPVLSPEQARTRVLRALCEVFVLCAEDRPLLLVVDDLQWADDLTLSALTLARKNLPAGARLMLVGAYRTEQCGPQLQKLVDGWGTDVLALDRLELSQVRAMVSDMLGTNDTPAGLAEFVHEHAEGNPFFVTECLRAAIEHGLVARDRTGQLRLTDASALTGPRDAQGALPASLLELLRMRTEGLSQDARRALELGALLGREFGADALSILDGDARDAVAGSARLALDELVARQIIEESRAGHYRFTHDKLREQHESAVPEPRRRELHRRIAIHLENQARSHSVEDGWNAAVGSHWAAANEPARALPYLERAAGHAEAIHASAYAVQLYALALRQAAALEDDTGRSALLAESLADVLLRSARHLEAREHYDAVLRHARSEDRLTRARAWRKKSQSFWTVHQYEDAERAIGHAHEELGILDPLASPDLHREWIEIERCRFFLLYFSRRIGEGSLSLIERVQPIVSECGTAVQRSSFFQCAAMEVMARTRYQHTSAAIDFARRAQAEVAGDSAHLVQYNEASFTLGLALALGGSSDCADAVEVLESSARAANETGDPTLRARALVYLAMAHRRLGDMERTLAVATEALEASDAAHLPPYLGAARACLAWHAWRTGEEIRAQREAETARTWWNKGPHPFPFRWQATFVLLDLAHKAERFSELWSLVDELLHEQQQLFPEPLQGALHALSRAREVGDDAVSAAASDLLKAAQTLRYL